jgi:lipoprotein NlpI
MLAIASLLLVISLLSSSRGNDDWQLAVKAANAGDFEQAVAQATTAIGGEQPQWPMYYHRGRWNFRLGNIKASLADFDEVVRQAPQRGPSLWERGITCYYAGKYAEGTRQFEAYQTFHNNDVENAVWRYLCQAKVEGQAKAREAMLPIRRDLRVPMMTVYELFQGTAKPSDVLDRVLTSSAQGEVAKQERFHAQLYLALYHDASGDIVLARKHIDRAVALYDESGPYMWAVAKQHQSRLAKKLEAAGSADGGSLPSYPSR